MFLGSFLKVIDLYRMRIFLVVLNFIFFFFGGGGGMPDFPFFAGSKYTYQEKMKLSPWDSDKVSDL